MIDKGPTPRVAIYWPLHGKQGTDVSSDQIRPPAFHRESERRSRPAYHRRGAKVVSMLARPTFAAFLFASVLPAQSNWFQPTMLKEPSVAKALRSIDDRSSARGS